LGQTNLPMLNRVGYFLFWNSVWEDFFNYTRALREDYFVKDILTLILIDRLLFSKFFYSFKYYTFLQNYSSNFFSNFKYFYELRNSFKKSLVRFTPVYFSKIWLIRYQKWFLVSIYIYKPIVNKKFQRRCKLNKPYYYMKNFISNKNNWPYNFFRQRSIISKFF
jgi:hypothetical protein